MTAASPSNVVRIKDRRPLKSPNRRKDEYSYRDELPFMARGRRPSWWSVTPSGQYQIDYQTGRAYAVAFWRACGGRPACGLELGQILFAMHDPARRKSKRWDGLSGIEVGFIRTIGEIIDIATAVPVLVGQGPDRIQAGIAKTPHRSVRMSAKLTRILLEAKHGQDRKRAANVAASLH